MILMLHDTFLFRFTVRVEFYDIFPIFKLS